MGAQTCCCPEISCFKVWKRGIRHWCEDMVPLFPCYMQLTFLKILTWIFLIQVRNVVAVSILLKGLGGLLFVFGSSIGAHILVRVPFLKWSSIFYLVSTYQAVEGQNKIIFAFSWTLRFWIMLLMLQLCYLIYTAPILHDFYNYKHNEPEFFSNLQEFLQVFSVWEILFIFFLLYICLVIYCTEKLVNMIYF